MREFRQASNKSAGSIDHRLDVGESDLREADKKRIAIVNSRTKYFNPDQRCHPLGFHEKIHVFKVFSAESNEFQGIR